MKLALALVLATAAAARADDAEPDRGAREKATEANLESTAPREGVTIGLSIGGAALVGIGTQNAIGRGGALSLRLGHVATPRTVITFEVTFMNMLHDDPAGNLQANTDANLLAGAQYYTSTSLWLRGAAGLGGFARTGYIPTAQNSAVLGPAALFGVGLDLIRRHFFTLDLQLASIVMANREGVLFSGSLGIGVNYY